MVRHAQASSVPVELAVRDDDLVLAVEGDGGPTGPWTPGVGILTGTQEAPELGRRRI